MSSTALASLYGGKVARKRKALAGNVGGQEREQTVLTPQWFIEALLCGEFLPTNPPRYLHGPYVLALDPCTVASNPTNALVKCTKTENVTLTNGDIVPSPFDDGLQIDWMDTVRHAAPEANGFAYVNPPFAELEEWLSKCAEQAAQGCPVHALIPFRPHRKWFGNLLQASHATIKSLAPFPFVGSKSAFPAPLALCSWNIFSPVFIGRPAAKGKRTNIVLKEWKL